MAPFWTDATVIGDASNMLMFIDASIPAYLPGRNPAMGTLGTIGHGIGWALGSSWESFHSGFRFADYAIALAIAAAIVFLLWRRRSRRRRRAAEQSGTLPG